MSDKIKIGEVEFEPPFRLKHFEDENGEIDITIFVDDDGKEIDYEETVGALNEIASLRKLHEAAQKFCYDQTSDNLGVLGLRLEEYNAAYRR